MGREESIIYSAELLKELMEETLSSAVEAYDVLVDNKHNGEYIYQVSMNFLLLSNQSYLAAKILCNEKELESPETYLFFDSFKNYKHELKEYISEKDDNSSWLNSRKNQFIESCNGAIRFLSNYVEDYKKVNTN